MSEPKKLTPIEWTKSSEDPDAHGYDGPLQELTPEQKKAKADFEAMYGDAVPTVELDEYGEPIDVEDGADPALLEAARTMGDPTATVDEREDARALLLAAPGLEEYAEVQDDEDDEPTTRAERIAEIAEGTRLGNQPIDPYANPKMDGPAGSRDAAVRVVAQEAAIQRKARQLLGEPGYTQEHRPENERLAIKAVRDAMLRQKGIEPSDLDNPPEVGETQAAIDELFDGDIEQERLDEAEALEQ